MNQMKHWLATIAVLLFCITANSATKINGINYNLNSSNRTAEVTSAGDYSGSITIPATVIHEDVQYSVTSIGYYAFEECNGITSITIPANVTNIWKSAFEGCSSLTTVNIPEDSQLTSIGNSAFERCSNLISITIPISVTSIGYYAFEGCSSLTAITIPENVAEIGNYAFSSCVGLTSITIKSITPPTTSYYTFEGVDMSIPIYVPIGSVDAYQSAQHWSEFTNIRAIPSNIASGTCGENLTWRLTEEYELIIEGTGEMTSSPWTDDYSSEIKTVIIGEGVTNIENYAFYYCSSLTSITIPKSVTSIEGSAFGVCRSLTTITFPENSQLTSIGSSAFGHCRSLTAITIPESVTKIERGAFSICESLTTIIIPKNVTSIGEGVFPLCRSLTSIIVDEENTVYDSRGGCNAIIETSSNSLIAGCSTTIIPEDVTSIGRSAFEGCESITSITIPESVKNIGEHSFSNCENLTDINIPEGVTSIGRGTFSGCRSLTDITIPAGVTSIERDAFGSCFGLTTITCEAATPPTIGGSYTFRDVDKSIPVYVPAGSVEAYRSAQYWSEFSNILPLPNEYTLSVSAAGYATMFLDYAVEIPENVEVYYASKVQDSYLVMTPVEGAIPAETGVVIKAAEGVYTFDEVEGISSIEGSLFVGTTEDTYITAAKGYRYYVLAQVDGVVGMYRAKIKDNGTFLNNANKAYLTLDMNKLGIYDEETNTDEEGGQLSNGLRFRFGGSTGVELTIVNCQQTTVIYDLQGRRVTDTEGLKGIYIVDGKKVVIK